MTPVRHYRTFSGKKSVLWFSAKERHPMQDLTVVLDFLPRILAVVLPIGGGFARHVSVNNSGGGKLTCTIPEIVRARPKP
jgi:hypothetical protein